MAVATAKRILPPGTRIAGYSIEAEIGHGAMAVVYRARQLNLDRPVALKILSDELAANHEFVSRFFNEARAAAALSHAHIVQAYDAGIAEGGIHFFAMEYVEGETLHQRIRRQGYVRPGPGIEMAIDIADALNYGWQRQRLTHGDIKPENIMINQAGESKLADFGLAKVAGHDFSGSDILLTPLYAAPEMIRGEHLLGDCRSDIYAFGATLYHLFGGTPPFPGEKAQEVMQRHLTEPLEPLRQRNPAVPGRISDLVGQLLQKDSAQRPGNWEVVLASLREIRKALIEPSPASMVTAPATPIKLRAVRQARQAVPRPRRRSGGGWLVAVVLLLLVGTAGLIMAKRRTTARIPPKQVAKPPPMAGSGPAEPAPPADRLMAEQWEEVRQQALAESNPDRVLALLEDFGKRYAGQDLPTAFTKLLSACQEAARKRQGTQEPEVPAPSAGEAPGAADIRAPAPPSGNKEVADGGGEALPGRELTEARDDGADTPAATVTTAAQSAVPDIPGDVRMDAFVAYTGALAEFEYRFPLHIETYMKSGQEWLLTFTGDSPERTTVTFIVNTVLPALEEALPKLVANSEALIGMTVPGREYNNCTVASVDLKELTLREKTQYGVISRKLAWQRLDPPTTLVLYLSQKVATRATTWGDRLPFLALSLLTRNTKLFDDAARDLPETAEKASWERLRRILEKAPGESKALRLWQKATEAYHEGEQSVAYRLLLELQATRSGVAERYSEAARALVAHVSTSVPDVAGGALVRESAAQLDSDPGAALGKILLADARYGAADFPEKAEIEQLRRRAVAGLAGEGGLLVRLQQLRRQPQHFIIPFARPAYPGLPSLAMRMYLVASEASGNLVPGQADLLATLEGPCLLELGDWAGAERLLSKVPDNAFAALPPATRAAAWFSRGLVECRFGVASEKRITEALGQCGRDLADKADREFVLLPQILALEYGVFLRCGEQDLQPYLTTTGVITPRGPSAEQRARLILGLAALSVDRQQTGALARLVPAVFAGSDAAPEWGLADAEVAMVRLCASRSANAEALAAAMGGLVTRDINEWNLRVVASLALSRDSLDEAVWQLANEWIGMKGISFGPVGGSAIYDLALARIGQRLAANDLKGADATAAWALSLTYPCMAPYYARLTFVRWGVARLLGGGGSRELGEQVEAASCANRVEKLLSRVSRGESLRDKAKDAVRDNPEGKFWFDWLTAAERLGGFRSKDPRPSVERFSSSRLPRAEQALANGMLGWLSHADDGVPGQERDKPRTP